MIKEKFKNCLLTVILSILFIASMFAIIGLSSCNVKKTILSNDINIENDNLNLKKDFHIDDSGNVVSDNVWSIDNGMIYDTEYGGNWYDLGVSNDAYQNVLSNTTYTLSLNISKQQFIKYYDSNKQFISDSGQYISNTKTFTTPSNCVFIKVVCVGYTSDILIMLNLGSTALAYEPYGVWYPHSAKQNFLNGFYGWEFYLHSTSATPYESNYTGQKSFLVINDINYLNNAVYTNQFFEDSYLQYFYNSPISINPFTYFYVWSFEMEFTFKFYLGNTLVYTIDSNNSDRGSYVYTFDRDYQFDSFVFISKDGVWEEDTPMCCLSYAETITSYNDGVKAGQQQSYETINNLNATIVEKNNTISDLQFTIRELNERLNTNINSLFYTMISSVMSTPFNILHDYLNWNFFGINLFSLFTSLVTLLIILWVVKFLLGRK